MKLKIDCKFIMWKTNIVDCRQFFGKFKSIKQVFQSSNAIISKLPHADTCFFVLFLYVPHILSVCRSDKHDGVCIDQTILMNN